MPDDTIDDIRWVFVSDRRSLILFVKPVVLLVHALLEALLSGPFGVCGADYLIFADCVFISALRDANGSGTTLII